MGKKVKENYLDYIPRRNVLYEWQENKNGNVEVKVHNKGLFNRIAQIFFQKPKYSYIELDNFGSFIWKCIDGEATVYDIGEKVKSCFGEEAEPLYDRLCKFMKILHENHYIVYVNKLKEKTK